MAGTDTVTEAQLSAFSAAAAARHNTLKGSIGTLANLATIAKGDLVSALNEVKASVPGTVVVIDDATTSGTKVWSSTKVAAAVAAATSALVASSPAALDTLNELATALGNDANFAATVNTALGNRLRFDAAQALTAPQKVQALSNLGIVASTADFAATFNAATA